MTSNESMDTLFTQRILKIFDGLNTHDWTKTGQKSKHWRAHYDQKIFNERNLRDFKKGKILSRGLDDNHDFTFRTYARFESKLSEDYLLSFMPEDNVGNGDLVFYKERYIDLNKFYHSYWYTRIKDKVFNTSNDTKIICEIGGGYGSFSEIFMERESVKVILIDLPEANLLSTYYLHEHFPDKRFFLYDDYQQTDVVSRKTIEENDVIILPPNCRFASDVEIDLFVNTRSMMEMTIDTVQGYFSFIQRHCSRGGYFLNINRYEKWMEGVPIRIAEYPYDEAWDVALSEPSFNQEHIHLLLTRRLEKDQKGDIGAELERVHSLGLKYFSADNPKKRNVLNSPLIKRIRYPIKNFFRELTGGQK